MSSAEQTQGPGEAPEGADLAGLGPWLEAVGEAAEAAAASGDLAAAGKLLGAARRALAARAPGEPAVGAPLVSVVARQLGWLLAAGEAAVARRLDAWVLHLLLHQPALLEAARQAPSPGLDALLLAGARARLRGGERAAAVERLRAALDHARDPVATAAALAQLVLGEAVRADTSPAWINDRLAEALAGLDFVDADARARALLRALILQREGRALPPEVAAVVEARADDEAAALTTLRALLEDGR